MTRLGGLMAGSALAIIVIAPLTARADDQDVIDYRQHIMKTMAEQAAAIDMILEHRAPADSFATHLQILAITAATVKKAFEPKIPGGNAKPDVWANWADFAKRLDTFVASTNDLAKTLQDGDIGTAKPKVQAAVATCKSCHDTYVVPK